MNLDIIKKFIHPIHKEGYIFIAIFFVASLFLYSIWEFLGVIGFVLTAWCVYFFRDPVRYVPQNDGLIVAPADGTIVMISKAKLPSDLDSEDDEEKTRVSIFLSVLDVHVNRMPVAGVVEKIKYHAGKFLSAETDKASDENERNSILIKTEDGKNFGVVQIAGLIARRIVCDAKEGREFARGERYGIIRFGSRVDIYMPPSLVPKVAIGQKVIGGETIIAEEKPITEELSVREI
ncbi:MAG: phosphatidylserine decarboxylase [Rickettsiales bacterium]|nr:phosphatidylserine decarboxylase [Rickettsiales bacterium]